MTKGKVTIVMLSVALAFAVGILVSQGQGQAAPAPVQATPVQASPQQWEYSICVSAMHYSNDDSDDSRSIFFFKSPDFSTGLHDSFESLNEELGGTGEGIVPLFNQIGSLGWEYVGVDGMQESNDGSFAALTMYIFKRPASN